MSREEETTSGTATNLGVINTVSLKLPTFWSEEVEVWFAQAEAQFAIKRIMDSRTTKFYYAVYVLPQDVAPQLLDLLCAPSASPYESLKDRLFQLYSLNHWQRFEALVNLPLVVDQKNSILINKLLALHLADFQVLCSEVISYDDSAEIRFHLTQLRADTRTGRS